MTEKSLVGAREALVVWGRLGVLLHRLHSRSRRLSWGPTGRGAGEWRRRSLGPDSWEPSEGCRPIAGGIDSVDQQGF